MTEDDELAQYAQKALDELSDALADYLVALD